MPYWCIDPTNGDDGTGASDAVQATAETTPYKTLAAVEAAGPAAGDSILFKGGAQEAGYQTLDAGTDGSAGSPITIGSYGTGRGGVDANSERGAINTNNNVYLTLDNLDLSGGKNDGSNAITLIINGGDTTAKNIIVKNSHIHDAEYVSDDQLAGDGHGIDSVAANITIQDNEVNGFPDDGIFIGGNDCEVAHNYIYDVDQTLNIKSGDCLKFVGTYANDNFHAHHNILDHSTRARKQALIVEGTGSGGIAEHNRCIGGEWPISSKQAGARIRRNLVEPLKKGTRVGSVAAADIRCINFQTGDGSTVESNIIHSKSGKEPAWGIRNVDTDDLVIQGNVLYGELDVDEAYGNEAWINCLSGLRMIIRNNIIGGNSNGNMINASPGVTFDYCDYNIYLNDGIFRYNNVGYADFNTWKSTNPDGFDANSQIISADTLFVDAANGDFRIKSGEAVAGVQVGYRDFLGRTNFPTIIGAYIQQTMISSTGNAVDTTAGTIGTTNGTVLSGAKVGGSSVYGDAVKYPEWGIRT